MEHKDSLPCSHEPAISHYHEPDEFNSHPQTWFPYDKFYYYMPTYT